MNTIYARIRHEEREMISRGLSASWTLTRMAEIINRDVSTVSREVNKNCRYQRCYRATRAQSNRNRGPAIGVAPEHALEFILTQSLSRGVRRSL